MNHFEYASRNKLRFQSSKGLLASEDLWALSLETLDTIAKNINKQVKMAQEESFISEKSQTDNDAEIQLEIVKAVIAHKLAQKEAASKRAATLAQKELIGNIISQKQNQALADMPLEKLQEMYAQAGTA